MRKTPIDRRSLLLAGLAFAALPVAAQRFPAKALSIVVPYPAGGPSDYAARQLQARIADPAGEPVIVENVSGAGGVIGVQRVMNSPADGRSLVFASPMEVILAPLAFSMAKYKPDDFRLIAHIGTADMVLLVRKDLPYTNVAELIAAARTPGAKELSYGSLGQGTFYHLVAERFCQLANTRMLHVPYKGAAPLLQDLMAGQIDLVFMPLAGNVRGLLQEGRIRALGITSAEVNPEFPSITPLATQASLKEMDFNVWSGLALPRKTPADLTEALHTAIYKALGDVQMRKNLESGGARQAPAKSLQELDAMYAADIRRYQAMASALSLRPQ